MSVGPKRRRSQKESRREGRERTAVSATRTCFLGGKRGYSSKSQAKRALKHTNRQRASAPTTRYEVAVYLCRCGQWHTTSAPQQPH